jgi:hypothetical protein
MRINRVIVDGVKSRENTPPVNETLHAPSVAQMSVTPSMSLSDMLLHEYEPAAKVIVAPSLALFNALWTCCDVLPAAQVQAVPEPEHAAHTDIGRKKNAVYLTVYKSSPNIDRTNCTQTLVRL